MNKLSLLLLMRFGRCRRPCWQFGFNRLISSSEFDYDGAATAPLNTTLSGQAAFVTGGASGIGKEICLALLDKNAKVCIADFDKRSGTDTVAEMMEKFPNREEEILFLPLDVTSSWRFELAVKKARHIFGHLDIIINNAGIVDENNWEKTVDVNLNGVIRGTLLGLQHLRNKQLLSGGCIVNTAAMTGVSTGALTPAFVASKHGVVGWSKCWGTDEIYKLTGVRVNCILPEHTDSPMMDMWVEGTIESHRKARDRFQKISTNGLLKPKDVAACFIKVIEDGVNGALLAISREKGAYYVPFEKYLFF